MSFRLSAADVAALERAINQDNSLGHPLVRERRDRMCAEVAHVTAMMAKQHLRRGRSIHRDRSDISTAITRYRVSVGYVDTDSKTTPDTIVVLVGPLEVWRLSPRELAARFFLTSREMEAAQLLRTGLSNRAIAAALGISVNTARRHVEHVLLKLGVHSRAAVAARLYAE